VVHTYAWPAFAPTGTEDLSVLRDQARTQGYEDGYQSGHQSAIQELEAVRRATGESLAHLPDLQRRIESEDQQQLLGLITQITSALLGVELTTNPEIVASIVDEAVEQLNCERSALTLTIAAEDEAWLQVEGLHTVVVEDQQPGTFSLQSRQAAAEFDPVTRLRALIEAAHDAD